MNTQNIFNFKSKPNYEGDNFFISSSNQLAHKILLNNDNPENCIFLYGPAKSGKSHLAKLWQKNNKAILFKENNFKNIMNQKKNILIEDLKLIFDEEKIFHTINHVYNNNLKILITSSYFTSEFKFSIKDLSSRIKSFYFIEISQPDDDLMYHLVIKLLYDKQIRISNDDILSFILKRINRTYLDIYNFIEKIDKLSLSKKKQITIPLIKELL